MKEVMAFQRNGIHFSYFFCWKEENERWKRKKGKRVGKRRRKMNSSEMTSHFPASIFASLRIHQIPKTMWRRWYWKERRKKTHLEKSETIKTNRNKPPPPPPFPTSFLPLSLPLPLLPSLPFLTMISPSPSNDSWYTRRRQKKEERRSLQVVAHFYFKETTSTTKSIAFLWLSSIVLLVRMNGKWNRHTDSRNNTTESHSSLFVFLLTLSLSLSDFLSPSLLFKFFVSPLCLCFNKRTLRWSNLGWCKLIKSRE